MNKKQTLHVINATHWDREWLLPFELYRMKSVEYNDNLLELMENDPDFKHYHFDGQVICIEDYLDIRPEKRQVVSGLVQNDRILIGPWYTLPDMNLISGESIIRNLLTGIKISGRIGKVMLEGYTACSNGQISQLPQIYAGFGINSAVIYKGLTGDRMPKEFLWESPDGTSIFTVQMADQYGRCNFYCLLYQEVICNVIHDTPDNNWEYELKEDKLPFRVDSNKYGNPYQYINLKDEEGFHGEHLGPYLTKLWKQASRGSVASHFLAFNGMDHTPPFPLTSRLIAEADKYFSGLEITDSSLPEAIAEIRKDTGRTAKLRVHRGEFRDPKITENDRTLNGPTLSFRPNIKITNREVEHLLIDIAEPLAAWAWLKGAVYPASFLLRAWKLLLANHGHDSIDGCSIDKVNHDVLNRYRSCEAICEGLIEQSLGYLVKKINLPEAGHHNLPRPHIMVFNPALYSRSGLGEMHVDLKDSRKNENICLVDEQGNKIKTQHSFINESDMETEGLINNRPMKVKRYKLLFRVEKIASMSYRNFKLILSSGDKRAVADNLSPKKNVMENEYLKVNIKKDGRLDILNKGSNKLYPGLHFFCDEAEAGDPWTNKPVANTEITNLNKPADIELIENGPVRATYKIRTQILLPVPRPDIRKHSPRKEPEKVTITSFVSLHCDSRRVDIKTVINNTAKDHKLVVCFPAGLDSRKTYAGGQYDVLERPTKLPDMSGWLEKISGYPNYGFFGISDGENGLSVLNTGLPEYFIDQRNKRTLTLTLLRSTQLKRWPEDKDNDQVSGGQCPGRLSFRYAIYPHKGNWKEGRLWQEYRDFACPLVTTQYFGNYKKNNGEELISLKPDALEYSCIKKAENDESLIIRIWNPFNRARKGMIKTAHKFNDVVCVDFNETALDSARICLEKTDDNTVRFKVGKKKIITLLFKGIRCC